MKIPRITSQPARMVRKVPKNPIMEELGVPGEFDHIQGSRIVGPAIKLYGKTYTLDEEGRKAVTHADIVSFLEKRIPKKQVDAMWDELANDENEISGFVTDAGEYLTRRQAMKFMQQREGKLKNDDRGGPFQGKLYTEDLA